MKSLAVLFVVCCVLVSRVSGLDARTKYEKTITGSLNITVNTFETYQINRFVASTVHNISITGHCNDIVPCNLYLVSRDNYLKALQQHNMDGIEAVEKVEQVGSELRNLAYSAQQGQNFETLFRGLYLVLTAANTTEFQSEFTVDVLVDLSWIQMIIDILFGTVKAAVITGSVLLVLLITLVTCVTITCCFCCRSSRSKDFERRPLITNAYYNPRDNRNNRVL